MDSAHDLGGKAGHGPVATDEPLVPFHSDWEARMWGIARSIAPHPSGGLDWWRHCRECIGAVDYLERPYFDSWMQTWSAYLIDQGLITLEELTGAAPITPLEGFTPPAAADAPAMISKLVRFDRPAQTPPRFEIGAQVRCTLDVGPGHTRLPAYVRGRSGTIIAQHGEHVYPDQSARGMHDYDHLYTVEFMNRDLWPEAAGSDDSVCLDLWQSYLEPGK